MTLIGMDPEQVRELAGALNRSSGALREIRQQVGGELASAGWDGVDAAQFREQWTRCSADLMAAADGLDAAQKVLLKQADEQVQASEVGGGAMGAGGFVTMTSAKPEPNPTPLPPPTPPGEDAKGDRRDPDRRDGRRVRNDNWRDRADPRDSTTDYGHLSNDWAGRAILERYLAGEDDWVIDNDPTWTQYMQSNPSLTQEMEEYNNNQATTAVQQYLQSGQRDGTFATQTSVEMENGEGIVGYQYLHGTNSTVGGFQHNGTTSVKPLPDGTYEVTVNSNYQWNDVIDPNDQYSTDRRKSQFAEFITLGQADPYNIHIGWRGSSTVIVDAQGNVVSGSGKGWPY